MKKAIALRHIHFEDLGTLHAEFASRGYEVQYVDPSIGELDTLTWAVPTCSSCWAAP